MRSEATVEHCCWFGRCPVQVSTGSRRAALPGIQTRMLHQPFKTECEMSLLYVFAASGMEGQPIRRIGVPSGSNSTLRCGSNDLFLITSGIGPVNAKKHAEAALISSVRSPAGPKPDAVLIIGLCGG